MNRNSPFITVTGARAPGSFKIRYERIESMESTGAGTQVFLIGALDPLYLAETPDEVEALIVKADALEWDEQIESLANPPELSPEVQKARDDLLEVKGRFTFNHTPGSNPEMSRIRVEFRDITEHQKHADHILGSDNVYVNWEDMKVKPNATVQKFLLELSIACNLMLKELYMKGEDRR